MKLNKVIFFIAFLFAPFVVASQDIKQALAIKYVDLRGSTWGLQQPSKSPVTNAQRQEYIKHLFESVINSNPKSKHWVAGHPARKALSDALEPELTKLTDLTIRTRGLATSVNLRDVFIDGIASMFSETELQELLAYYSGPQGKLLISKQQTINERVQISLLTQQANFSSNVEWPRRTNPDPEKMREILSLFDEAVKIQLAISDPGPDGDRTGLQAIGMATTAGVVDVFPEILAEWEQIPLSDRLEILNRRKSAQGLNEREVIYKAAGKIRGVYKPEQAMQEMLKASINLEVKAEQLIERFALRFP